MNDNKPVYIMSEQLYNQLSSVRQFTSINGKSYKEHIVFIFNLECDIKEKVLDSETTAEALQILRYNNINFTHELLG